MSEPGERRRRREMERAATEVGGAPADEAATAASRAPQWASSWPEPARQDPVRPQAPARPEQQSRPEARPPTASRRALREHAAPDQPSTGGTPVWAAPRQAASPSSSTFPAPAAPSAVQGRSTLGPTPRTGAAPGRVPPPVPAQGAAAPSGSSTQGGVRPPLISDAAYRSRRATRDTLDPTAGPRSSITPPPSTPAARPTQPARPAAAPQAAPAAGRPATGAGWGASATPPSSGQPPMRTPVSRDTFTRPAPPSPAAYPPAPANEARPQGSWGAGAPSGQASAPSWAPGSAQPGPVTTPGARTQNAPAWAPEAQVPPPARSGAAPESTSDARRTFGGAASAPDPVAGTRSAAWTPARADAAPAALQPPSVAAGAVPTPAAEQRRGSWAVAEPTHAPGGAAAGENPSAVQDVAPPVAFPSPRTAPPDVHEDDDEPVVSRHPYTWLHLIVLALVAFVLGFLVVALWNHGRQPGTAGAEGSAASVVVSAQAIAHADPTTAL